MLKELIVGCQGYVGKRLLELTNGEGASHGNPIYHHHHLIDLRVPLDHPLPDADVVYICAAINGAMKCEGNAQSYRVNVDGTFALANEYRKRGSFVVWVSSRSLEWSTSAYAMQKRQGEALLTPLGVGIVRAGRVTDGNLDDLCGALMTVGRNKVSGLTVWGTDDVAYR